jgi:hypothetical protein
MFDLKLHWHSRFDAMRRAMLACVLAGAGLGVASPAAAQVTYTYTGNPFTLFSCGGSSICGTAGLNANTSYTGTDLVTATLELSAALAPNLVFQDVSGLAGFRLTLRDQHQTMVAVAGYTGGFEAKVSTDSAGRIIGPWSLIVNCCFYPNNGVATLNNPGGNGVGDQGVLSAPSAIYPTTPLNSGYIFGSPGTWTTPPSSPSAATSALITVINTTELGLTVGQVASLTDKLNSVQASIAAGLNKQAINQLNAFINSVESAQKTGKMIPATAATLIAAANAIIALL